MNEIYRNIEDFDNYEISNFGNVRNKKTNKILKPNISKGYYKVDLCKNGKRTTKTIHKLVADAFLENLENKPCVDHIDNDRLNNNISNLRWATNKENSRNKILSIKNTSGFKGVSFHKKANKWQAQITIDGIKIYIGSFENIEDAKQARLTKAQQVFGVYMNSCEN